MTPYQSLPTLETAKPQAFRLPPPSLASDTLAEGESTSTFSWVWGKITGFFSWLFGCGTKQEVKDSNFFRDCDGKEVKYRLLVDGKGTENEIRLTPNSAMLNGIEIPDEAKSDEVGAMLKEMMEKENIHTLTTYELEKGKLLFDLGLEAKGALSFDLQGNEFIDTYFIEKFKEAFESQRPDTDEGKLVLKKIEEAIVSGIIGYAFVIEDDDVRQVYIRAAFDTLELVLPGFDVEGATLRAERGTTLTEDQKALLEAMNAHLQGDANPQPGRSMMMSFVALQRPPPAAAPPPVDLSVSIDFADLFELFEEMDSTFQRGLASPQKIEFHLPKK